MMIMTQELGSLLFNLKTIHEDLKPISTGIVAADWVRLKCRRLQGIRQPFLLPTLCTNATGNEAGSFGLQICRAGQDPGPAFFRPIAKLGQSLCVRLQDKAPEGRI
jgi:hypothetical protein